MIFLTRLVFFRLKSRLAPYMYINSLGDFAPSASISRWTLYTYNICTGHFRYIKNP